MGEFQDLMKRTAVELSFEGIADALGIRRPYAYELWRGKKPISEPIRAKIDALIAAKDNGQVGFTPTPTGQRTGPVEPEPVKVADLPEPGGTSYGLATGPLITGYRVEPRHNGFEVVKVAAITAEYAIACSICDLLNGENG